MEESSLIVIFVHLFTLCANKWFPLQWKIPDRKAGTRAEIAEMTSQNCNLIGYSMHLASNSIMRGIQKFHRKVMFIIFTKIFPI